MPIRREVFDLRNRRPTQQTLRRARLLVSEQSPNSTDAAAKAAFESAGRVYGYFFDKFGVDSYNNGGRPILMYVHAWKKSRKAEYISRPQSDLITLGDGNGRDFSSTAEDLTVIAHEMTHAYIERLSRLVYGIGDHGAIIEHLCDVFAVLIRQAKDREWDNWEVGSVFTRNHVALRDLGSPRRSRIKMRCAGHMREKAPYGQGQQRSNYTNAGVLSRAFVLASQAMGVGAGVTLGKHWFKVMRTLPQKPSLREFKKEIVSASSGNRKVLLQQAFQRVGLGAGGS